MSFAVTFEDVLRANERALHELGRLRHDHAALQRSYEQLDRGRRELRRKHTHKSLQLWDAERQVNTAHNAILDLRQQLREADTDKASLERALSDAKAASSRLCGNLAEARSKLLAEETARSQLEQRCARLEAERDALKRQDRVVKKHQKRNDQLNLMRIATKSFLAKH